MKLAFITPTAFIESFGSQGQITMALANLIETTRINEYEKIITKLGLPILLDNGAFETGQPDGIDSLITKALRIRAELVFAPDYLYDGKRTESALENFIYIAKNRAVLDRIKIAAIVQADEEEEYINQFFRYNDDDRISAIGINFLTPGEVYREKNKRARNYKGERASASECTEGRIKILERIKEKAKRRCDKIKPVHLLGLGSSYSDVLFARKLSWVKSNDTSTCFQAGLYGKRLEGETLIVPGGKIKEKVNFSLDELTHDQKVLIRSNIKDVLTKFYAN